MSQGTFSDKLIRIKGLKRIFVFRPKIDFLLRGQSMLFNEKMTKFLSGHFLLESVTWDPGVSKNSLGNHIYVQITPWQRIFCLTLTLISSFLGYFFFPGPLGGIKSVSGDIFRQTDSIESFKKNICISSKNRLFGKG